MELFDIPNLWLPVRRGPQPSWGSRSP